MLKKRIRIGICGISFILAVLFLWSNILILDDFHPAHGEIMDMDNESLQDAYTVNESSSSTETPTEGASKGAPTNKKGYHIHINLDAVIMYVYKNGELIKTYPVSGGKPSTPSPTGTWKIVSKDTWGEGFGGAWMGFNVPWGKYGIHGTIYPWFIGKSNSSKGCIRMLNKDVKELYKIVPHGATVTIVHSNRVFRTMKSGDIGSDVYEMQKALKKLGYFNGWASGKYGTDLKNGAIKFQKANKIYASGTINRQTYNLILQKVKEKEQEEERLKEEQEEQLLE